MHARAIPIHFRAQRLAVPIHVHTIFFTKAHEQITRDPHLVGGSLGAFAEDLELPLSLRDLGVDAFMVDAGIEAEIEMGINYLAGNAAHGIIAHSRVVLALWRRETAAFRESQRNP